MAEQTTQTMIEAIALSDIAGREATVLAMGSEIGAVIRNAGVGIYDVVLVSGECPAGWMVHEDRRIYPIGYQGESWDWVTDAYLHIDDRTRELAPTLGADDRQAWIGAAMAEAARNRRWMQVGDDDLSAACLTVDGETMAQIMAHSV